ncbi:retrovirus-related pol polyprotein from transposon TNT 1-94 [Tanacetum coccineum]
MVSNLPHPIIDKKNVCEGCILGKQSKKAFPVGKSKRVDDVLELIHADLYGPMRVDSLAGSKYFLLFTDDYCRMSWVYFIQQKSETFEHFKKFKAMVEKQSGKDLKGIKRELTAPYSPKQNGMPKRKNRTVVEMTRSVLKLKGLPNGFWVEGVAIAVYLLNISPMKVV